MTPLLKCLSPRLWSRLQFELATRFISTHMEQVKMIVPYLGCVAIKNNMRNFVGRHHFPRIVG